MNIMKAGSDISSKEAYRYLFTPASIAVVGASNDQLKPGGRVTGNIRDNHYVGELWAVNSKTPNVLDLPTFASIKDLPSGPELAIVAIPSRFVLDSLKELAEIGTKAVIILTSGFGEKSEDGKQAEQKMLSIAKQAGMYLVGPNCSGFMTTSYKGKFAGIIPKLPGNAVDFISGSGATVDYVMEYAETRGLSFGNVVNLGNSIQMGVEDILGLYDENYSNDSAEILMLYLEAVKKPEKLLRHATSLARKGCALVGIKSGATVAGEKAAASHTGAIASNDTAVQALFGKAGILRVDNRTSLVDTACVLKAVKGRLKGKRCCVVTDAGGPGVMMSDELSRNGFELPVLKKETREALSEFLPPEASFTNPVDILPSRSASQVREILQILEKYERDDIDIITFLFGDSGMSDNTPIYEEISGAGTVCSIPVIPMFSSLISSRSKIQQFISHGQIFFTDEVSLGKALGIVSKRKNVELPVSSHEWYHPADIRSILDGHTGALSPDVVEKLLRTAGFKLPSHTKVFSRDSLIEQCLSISFPIAMKVIGPLHKSDVGGVKLELANQGDALSAWDKLMKIDDAEGVLIQPMVQGEEVILGTSRKGDFGQLIMFGLGGIYTEVFKDVRFNLAPLTEKESIEMVRGIDSFSILEGIRGRKGMDVVLLAENLVRLSWLVTDFPEIKEIDLNPVKGVGSDLFVVDGRVIIG